jgi:hypothetical protein
VKFSKITKKINETSTEASLAPDSCTADYTALIHRVYCVVQIGPTPFCQTNTMQIVVACYIDRITILYNEALQLLLDSCLFFVKLIQPQFIMEDQSQALGIV